MPSNAHNRCVVITPARNEGSGLEETILSLCRQTVQPVEWVLVDDGSQDETGEIIDKFAWRYPWITGVHRSDRGFRLPGTGVIEAFQEGYRAIRATEWDYIVKLDADLTLEDDYFERCLEHFHRDPQIGIGGGDVYTMRRTRREFERNPRFHVRGATKMYRRACWEAIGGLIAAPGWDTLDEVKANMLGWRTRTFPDVAVLQRRPTGSRDGAWRDFVKNGRANYFSGYHPLFMLVKCLRRAFERPYLLGSLGLGYGFASGYLRNLPRVHSPALLQYIREQQMRRLLLRESIWK